MVPVTTGKAQWDGTPETVCLPWIARSGWSTWPLVHWLPLGARAVVVAPRPDDEIIAFGGLLAAHARHGGNGWLVAVTDGEASHPKSSYWTPSSLAAARMLERNNGLARLGLGSCSVHRCQLPDGDVARHDNRIETLLSAQLQPTDVLLTTWRLDGHPDHESTGAAVARVAARYGHRLIEAPVWMWHWATPGDAKVPWSALSGYVADALDGQAKQGALAAHRSQWFAEDDERSPVLGPQMIYRAARRTEWFFDDLDGSTKT